MSNPAYSDRTAFTPDGGVVVDLTFLSLTGLDRNYIRSFSEAAELLVERVLTGPEGGNDRLIFTIGFLFRHYLELQCKYLIEAAWHLHNKGPFKPKKGHFLKELWDETRKAIQPEFPEFTDTAFDSVESIIYQFDAVDPTGVEFRYARTLKGDQSLNTIPSVSIEKMNEAMERAKSFLDQWAFELDIRFDEANQISE